MGLLWAEPLFEVLTGHFSCIFFLCLGPERWKEPKVWTWQRLPTRIHLQGPGAPGEPAMTCGASCPTPLVGDKDSHSLAQ